VSVKEVALVTGAAGFIGQHLCEALVAEGWAVRGLDDERCGDWSRSTAPIERRTAPLEEMDTQGLRDLCEGIDVVFHLAAEKHNSPRATARTLIEVNIAATERLYAAAGRSGVRRIVFASSLYAYGSTGPDPMRETDLPQPSTAYGVSKLAGEHLLRVAERNFGVGWAIGRLFFVYGSRQFAEGGYKSVIVRNFERILSGRPPIVNGDGEQVLDYLHVDDCVRGLLALGAQAADRSVYNLASGRGVSVNQLTRAMLEVAESELQSVHAEEDWTDGTIRVGAPEAAERDLGWSASMPMTQGLARVWAWLRGET
jgi:UDP-glucose 4-epimerase